jgi:diadenosine tetraphosphate (Ap4A) HIT family hydrolase
MNTCPFCAVSADRILLQNELMAAIHDAFPLSKGHTLVIPRRHVTSVFELNEDEFVAMWLTVHEVRKVLQTAHRPSAFNVGINDGKEAGQTVSHAHVHVIPRYTGDVPDPRGGVRSVLPSKARYWTE